MNTTKVITRTCTFNVGEYVQVGRFADIHVGKIIYIQSENRFSRLFIKAVTNSLNTRFSEFGSYYISVIIYTNSRPTCLHKLPRGTNPLVREVELQMLSRKYKELEHCQDIPAIKERQEIRKNLLLI